MAWMEMDYSKHTLLMEDKWQLENLGALGIMGDTAPSPKRTPAVSGTVPYTIHIGASRKWTPRVF